MLFQFIVVKCNRHSISACPDINFNHGISPLSSQTKRRYVILGDTLYHGPTTMAHNYWRVSLKRLAGIEVN